MVSFFLTESKFSDSGRKSRTIIVHAIDHISFHTHSSTLEGAIIYGAIGCVCVSFAPSCVCMQAYYRTDVGIAEFGFVVNMTIVIVASFHLAVETLHWVSSHTVTTSSAVSLEALVLAMIEMQ